MIRRAWAAAVAVPVVGVLMMVPPAGVIPMSPAGGTTPPSTTPILDPPAGVPPVAWAAVQAGAAHTEGGCRVRWPAVAAVMQVESGFGTSAGSQADARGVVSPPIFGPVLAPGSGFAAVPNDDYGRTLGVEGPWARAVGPTQFLPDTWKTYGRDGNRDGKTDPQDLFDAAASTAAYLCASGWQDNVEVAERTALYAYNPSIAYVATVLAAAARFDTTAGQAMATNGLAAVAGITVHQTLAGPLARLLADAAADGVQLGGWGWRSPEDQIDLRRRHCGTSDYAVFEMPSGLCTPPTARPGTSMHERGLAVDLYDQDGTLAYNSVGWRWMSTNAARYGLYPCGCGEFWHFSTTGA